MVNSQVPAQFYLFYFNKMKIKFTFETSNLFEIGVGVRY